MRRIRRSIRSSVVFAAVGGLLAQTSTPALAWGMRGHHVVARIAEKLLTDKARAGVRELLDPGEDMAAASTYADEHKREIRGSAPWHYVNVPIDEDRYRDEFCDPTVGCIVSKIEEFRATLKDKSKPRAERQMALRFLIHLVGDLHQPLHVGDNRDRGGNDTQVRFFDKGSNLHKVWDIDLMDRVNQDEDAWLQTYDDRYTPLILAKTIIGTVEDWANESLAAAKKAYQLPGTDRRIKSGDKLGQDYLDQSQGVVRQRLFEAGVRLSLVLNGAFEN
jgi:hypothetical protein